MSDDTDDQSPQAAEFERAFRDILTRSGLVLESLDVTSATRVALEFFRDVRFDWISPDEDSDTSSVTTLLEREPGAPLNPLLALFSTPKPGPLESIVLNFERELTTVDDDLILWQLELEFDPDGLDDLEELDAYSNAFDSFEDFARAVLTHPSLQRHAGLRPRSVSLFVE